MASFKLSNDAEMLAKGKGNKHQQKFDKIIGTIEEIMVSDEFQATQQAFMEKYYHEFEDTEENKFVYTDIFEEYGKIMERFLVEELKQRIPNFSMDKFASSLQAHKDEMTDDIFDMIATFTDFLAFKEMFIDYKAEKEGRNVNLFDAMVVHSVAPNNVSAASSNLKLL